MFVFNLQEGEKLKKVSRWISNRNLPTRDGRFPLIMNHVDLDTELGSSGIRCISDINTCNLHPSLRNLIKNDGMTALVICALEGRAGETFGYVVFTQLERRRKWSRKETNTFKYLSKILSVALSEKYADHSLIGQGAEELPPKKDE